jgi:thiamine biosynthesis protein ThiS
VTISLNGDHYDLAGPMTVAELLTHLAIDSRRVAVERNDVVVRQSAFAETLVAEGDHVEIVNFVGGG